MLKILSIRGHVAINSELLKRCFEKDSSTAAVATEGIMYENNETRERPLTAI